MTHTRGRSPLIWVTGWSARHPIAVLIGAAIIVVLSGLGLANMRISGSFRDMFGAEQPAAASLARIASEYRTTDELLVLVTSPGDGPGSGSNLADYAERLKRAIDADGEAAAMTAHVRYQRDPAYAEYVRRVVLPAGAYYLSDDGFEQLLLRLTPEGIRMQIGRAEALIAAPGPAADAIGRAVLRDPLRLAELVEQDSAAAIAAPAPDDPAPPELSDDGRTLLIRVAGQRQVDDLDFAQRFTARIGLLAQHENVDGLMVELAGGYAIAATTSRAIRADSIVSVVVSIVLLHALFLTFYRRPGAPLLIMGVAAVGILAGFGIHSLFTLKITPLTAVIAAMLAGLGIDYGIHFLSHYKIHRADGLGSADASVATVAGVGIPIVTTCIASIFGFASLWPSSVRMLSDFAVLGALGLLGSLASVLVLMPAVLALVDTRPAGRVQTPRFGGLVDAISSRPRTNIVFAVALLGAAIVSGASQGFAPFLEADLSVMHPRPNRPLELTDSLGRRFSGVGESVPLEIRAAPPEALVARAHEAASALRSPQARAAGVIGVLGLHQLLPDPAVVEARRRRLAAINPDSVVDSLDRVLAESAFDAGGFTAYRSFVRELLVTPPPTMSTVLDFPSIAERIFPRGANPHDARPSSTLMVVRLESPLNERSRRDHAVRGIRSTLAPVPGATLSGMSAITYDLEQATRGDLPQAVAISLALVVGWLAIVFRRPVDVLLALIPLVFAAVCTIGFMIWTNQHINAVNGVALPLLDGIAVDAGVFLVSTARAHAGSAFDTRVAFRSTAQAILAASTTTIAGFAALCFTRTPAIRSLGILTSVGVTASLCGALVLLLPILLLRSRRADRPHS